MPSGPIAHAWRSVRRSPGVLVLVVLTLALGIGGATAMFAVVDAMLLNPLPYANGDRLRELFIESGPADRNPYLDTAQLDAVRAQTGIFQAVERLGMGAETLHRRRPRAGRHAEPVARLLPRAGRVADPRPAVHRR